MGRFIDRQGMQYGRLRVISDAGVGANKKRLWKCLCECGKETTVTAGGLASGNTSSCGCYHKETITKHGGWNKSSYNTWRAMIRRCDNPLDKDYHRYGAKGINVCGRWKDYSNFVLDMGEPGEGETLDRVDGKNGYFKENCRWASGHIQAVNSFRPNKTGYRGVGYHKRYNKWIANITTHGKRVYSSMCSSLEEAISARKELEITYWGNLR